MSKAYLGIDTSNYTTSAALCVDGEIVKNVKRMIPIKEKECGARQSDALFSHIKALPEIMAEIGSIDPCAIGVSERPRDIQGSYMPCFLAGVASASSIASTFGVPLYKFAHQAGHVEAAKYSSLMPDYDKFIAFHISGGTTEMLLYENGKLNLIGGTLDINAGQLIDRVGVMLGLSFPCGASLEKMCDYDKVKPRINIIGRECNLSGLQNIAEKMCKDGIAFEKIAAFIILSIEKTLDVMTENALKEYGDLPLLYAGGVMSNTRIKNAFTKKYGAYFAKPEFSSDNAAGVALL